MITVFIPGPVPSAGNLREHWTARAKRVRWQRGDTAITLYATGPRPTAERYTVTLTRQSGKKLDDDNLRAALKAFRDGVQDYLKIDDGSDRVDWRYGQADGRTGVRIEITEALQ